MDITDLAEKFLDIKLADWQKEHIRTLDRLGKNAEIRICMPKDHGRSEAVYIYLNAKELILNGQTHDSKH